ncbi:dipeptide ABC transporter ATP-binding protein [Pseudooceanicola nanhaiensis]|uniref:dipeptide ABC transporter ATP-binding protein n=1 Tax=Pseudooceanicola nanhaiensis TaxID=375761 RepID=UPI001CD484C1|nr:ABC transporter ATP-binding protein [Pseudooceanicola nanhaiensis]MCA0922832.1 ABC transporter ATP-binding protein [Pseudooceanicola nanhaiensis]
MGSRIRTDRGKPQSEAPVLDVRHYSMAYDTEAGTTTALDDVSLMIWRGETHALVGESGSGKSTLAWAITRYMAENARDTGGAILLSGEDMIGKGRAELEALRGRRIAMVYQDPSSSLNPTMRLGEQLTEVLIRHRGMTKTEAWVEGEAALARTGIVKPAEMMMRYPHECSGGEKQRVVIATAFACNPELIIFDEPTTALDILTANQILDLFIRLREETGVAALYITHDLGLVARIASKVSVIHKGKIVEQGDLETVFGAPEHPYTRKLLAALPRPEDRLALPAPTEDTPLFEARDVGVQYNAPGWLTRLLDKSAAAHWGARNITLDVRPGELLGIVGESGSGKSTIAKAATGLNPFEGEIRFVGRSFASRDAFDRKYRRDVQIIFQHPDSSLNPRETIGGILSRPLKLYKLCPAGEVRQRVRELLEMVLLPADYASRYPHQLSGGEKQRVAIARAFAAEPRLVICDEITAALDVSVQAAVARLLVDLQKRSGAACIFITHDLNLIRQLAHRIVVFQRGALVDAFDVADAGSPERHPYTQALLNAVPVPHRPEDQPDLMEPQA